MSAKIITLTNVRRGSIKCSLNGVVFPELYRLSGFYWAMKEGTELEGVLLDREGLVPGTEPVPVSYTLEMGDRGKSISRPRWEPISHLVPGIDSGWVIVRHHANEQSLEAYVDAMCDTRTYEESDQDRWRSFRTPLGLFTVLHRPRNRDTVDHLLIFTTKVPGNEPGEWVDWNAVIGPDGMDRDIDDTIPTDELDRLGRLTDLITRD